jgi:tRNA nucleotidyltransferase/poly(A) polymerase
VQYPLTTNHKTHIAPKNQSNVLHPAEKNWSSAKKFNPHAHKRLAKKQPGENPLFLNQTRRLIQLWEEAAFDSQADAEKDAQCNKAWQKEDVANATFRGSSPMSLVSNT